MSADSAIASSASTAALARTIALEGPGEVGRLCWSRDGRFLAIPVGKRIVIWNAEDASIRQVLEGHSDEVWAVDLDHTGSRLASAARDRTIRIWDLASGQTMQSFTLHHDSIYAVRFAPTGSLLGSAGKGGEVFLWEPGSTAEPKQLGFHTGDANAIAFHPTEPIVATAGDDATIAVCASQSGELIRRLRGHGGMVLDVEFDPSGRILASCGDDATIKIWDAETGRELRSLQGHVSKVICVRFSPDGRLLVSRDFNPGSSLRVWDVESGACLQTTPISDAGVVWQAVAINPLTPDLVAVASAGSVALWHLGARVQTFAPSPAAISYTTAKLVLVGDSGVGKTGLGWRLSHGEFREHSSTHGQQFWLLPELNRTRDDGTQCEPVLWDLAGQPDYRIVHALFLDDVDVALVVFDATDTRDPLHGVEFWLKQLSVVGDGPRIILVAARADRGTLRLTRAEVEVFCAQRGVASFVETSALRGEGISELMLEMQRSISWERKTATITTSTFKRVKDYVLGLKESGDPIISMGELRARLEATDPAWRFSDVELDSAVGHLENHGYVRRLRTSTGAQRLLLAPELLHNLAASLVLEARRNARGLGSLEEKRLLSGEYTPRELEGLSRVEREALLDSAVLLFLRHNVCFRETDPLTSSSYLVFPELINLNRPSVEDDQPLHDATAYSVVGAVENVYPSLVVLLGYTQTFTRTDQWRDHARYEVGRKQICGFRQETQRAGAVDFVLYFGANVERGVRMIFQGLFESFLGRHNLTVFRYDPVTCPACHAVLERSVMRAKMRDGKSFAFCNDCGEKLTLPSADSPIQLRHEERIEVDTQRQLADLRSRFEQALFQIQSFVMDSRTSRPTCFVSYAWGVPDHERWVERTLAADLQKAGVDIIFDRWEGLKVGASLARFVERIEASDLVIVVGTPAYRQKYENADPSAGYVVAAEVDLIANRMLGTEAEKASVLPLLLDGQKKTSFPPLLHSRVFADFRAGRDYFREAIELIISIHRIDARNPIVQSWRQLLSDSEKR